MSIVPLVLVGLGAAIVMMTGVWVLSLIRRDASVVDIFWGLGFVVLGWLYYGLGDGAGMRPLLVPVLVTLWGLRLALYLAWRNWGRPEDYRYAAMRRRAADRFARQSLVTVFWLQALLLTIVALPLAQVQRFADADSARLGWLDGLGVALFALGLFFETVGDFQLARFKSESAHQGQVLDRGLWRYTRHPNYFGDFLVWWGLALIALATPGGWWTLPGPILMSVLLMRVSGVALLERGLKKSKPAYADYVARTNAFFPGPPRAR